MRVEFETVVRAADEAEAEEEAEWAVKHEDDPPNCRIAKTITDVTDLPTGWNPQCRPWGERDPQDRTIAQMLSANAGAEERRDGAAPAAGSSESRCG